GTYPYSYAWSNSGTAQNIYSLPPGHYSVTITDKNGCSAVDSIPVGVFTSTITISFNSLTASCLKANGSIKANPAGGSKPYSYTWSNGSHFQTANSLVSGNYTVNISDKNGCAASNSSSVVTNTVIPTPNICMVTVDSLSKNNLIMWNKVPYIATDSFIVYREIDSAVYQPIGAVPYGATALFTDTCAHKYSNSGDPNFGSYKYKIGTVDSCGNRSMLSAYHNTIYLINNSGLFSWQQQYSVGGTIYPVSSYVLMRDDYTTGNWHVITTISGTQQSVIDPGYPAFQSTASWRVSTMWTISCAPTYPISYTTSYSNIYRPIGAGINDLNSQINVLVSPNPSNGYFTVEYSSPSAAIKLTGIEIVNMLGEVVYSEKNVIGNSHTIHFDSPAGVYFLRLRTTSGTAVKKIIKE
ncbi:MAG TPA: T9SS type A sorting domain-containing protein, partial [Bacteroidia bacterium]